MSQIFTTTQNQHSPHTYEKTELKAKQSMAKNEDFITVKTGYSRQPSIEYKQLGFLISQSITFPCSFHQYERTTSYFFIVCMHLEIKKTMTAC